MIFSTGYTDVLPELVEILDAHIWDVRARVSGRVRAGWRSSDLQREFGDRYEWHGQTLGGRAFRQKSTEWIEAPIDTLMPVVNCARNVILLCACDAPWDCHRHNEIAAPLLRAGLADVLHIHEDRLIEASELHASLTQGTPYDYYDLCDWMENHV